MTVEEFVTKYIFRTEDQGADALSKKIDGLNSKLGALTALEIGKTLFHMAESFGNVGDELQAAAYSAGITSEAMQKLQYSAAQSGASAEDASVAMQRLARNLYEARHGGKEAQEAFRQVGISPEQLMGFKDAEAALHGVSDRFVNIQDPIKKAALMQELFGRGGAKMALWLSQGSKALKDMGKTAEEVGAVLRNDQVDELASVQDSFETLGQVVKTFSAGLIADIGPAVRSMIRYFLDWYAANRKIIEINFKAWADKFLYTMGYVAETLREVGDVILGFIGRHKELVTNVLLVITAFATAMWVAGKLGGAIQGLGNIFKAVGSPLGLVVGSLLALAVAVESIWEVLHGKRFEDTWLGQLLGPYAAKVGDLAKTFGFANDDTSFEVAADGSVRPKAKDPEDERLNRIEDERHQAEKQRKQESDESFKSLMSGTGVDEQGNLQLPSDMLAGAAGNMQRLMDMHERATGGGGMMAPPEAIPPPDAADNPSNTTLHTASCSGE